MSGFKTPETRWGQSAWEIAAVASERAKIRRGANLRSWPGVCGMLVQERAGDVDQCVVSGGHCGAVVWCEVSVDRVGVGRPSFSKLVLLVRCCLAAARALCCGSRTPQKPKSGFLVPSPEAQCLSRGDWIELRPGRASTKLAGLIRSQGRGACRLAFRAGGACLSKVFSSSLPRTSKFPKEKSSDGSRTGGDPSHLQQNSAVDRRGSTRRGNVSNPSAYAK